MITRRELLRAAVTSAAASTAALLAGPGRAQSAAPLAVAAVVASSRQLDFLGPQLLLSDEGLSADPLVPGRIRFAPNASSYTSGYGSPNDETPLVHFDFGAVRTVDQFHVWNVNDAGFSWRGFREVTLQFSDDAQRWVTVPERYVFQRAPGTAEYAGERFVLARPITARFIRFVCNSTWRDFGNPDVASLGRVRFFAGGQPTALPKDTELLPLAAGIVNVKLAPYFARGDGATDDTAALQRAIRDAEGSGRTIYLPEGVYVVSAPLKFTENASYNRNNLFGRNVLRGAGMKETVIRLRDGSLTDAAAPRAVVSTGFISFWNGQNEETTADWFHNFISHLTIDTGVGNPGAKGLEFFSNNTGAVRDVSIVSRDGKGVIGLDLGHLDKNGPLLVKRVSVRGFDVGIRTGKTVNSQTFDDIRLKDQRVTAFDNDGQCVSIRRLRTEGAVTALRNRFGFATIVDASLKGKDVPAGVPAILNGEYLYARDIDGSGFPRLIDNQFGAGSQVPSSFDGDYLSSGMPLSLFPGRAGSLALQVRNTPKPADDPADRWVNAREFRLTTELDDAPALQRAIDSGARTVFYPTDARVVLKSDVHLRGAVANLIGMHASVRVFDGARIRVVDGQAPHVHIERFFVSGADAPLFINASGRRISLTDSEAGFSGAMGGGDVFLENVVGRFEFGRHRTWARQLNTEPEGLKITNNGGALWILGLKTERAGTLVATFSGGATEILGGLCYTTTAGTDPMFRVENGAFSVSLAEVAYGPPPYRTLVRETRGGAVRSLERGQAPLRFSFMNGSALTLFVSGAP